MPPTYFTCLEIAQHADPRRGARGGRAGARPRRCSRRRSRATATSATLSIPDRMVPLLAARSSWLEARACGPGRVARSVRSRECVLAPNASPMTLDGTNTWVLRAPGVVALDRGRPRAARPGATSTRSPTRRGDVAVVLLTHHHLDHSEAARAFAERVGCGVRALDPAYRLGSEGLGEGDVVAVDDLEVHVVATPGHTSDSLSFVIPSERAVLTGDTVLGRGTTVVAHPDGELGAYLDSLDRLRALAEAHEIDDDLARPRAGDRVTRCPPSTTTSPTAGERLDQVREALRGLHAARARRRPLDHDALPRRIVEIVYADVDPVLWPAAELSVRAQLAYLHPLSRPWIACSPGELPDDRRSRWLAPDGAAVRCRHKLPSARGWARNRHRDRCGGLTRVHLGSGTSFLHEPVHWIYRPDSRARGRGDRVAGHDPRLLRRARVRSASSGRVWVHRDAVGERQPECEPALVLVPHGGVDLERRLSVPRAAPDVPRAESTSSERVTGFEPRSVGRRAELRASVTSAATGRAGARDPCTDPITTFGSSCWLSRVGRPCRAGRRAVKRCTDARRLGWSRAPAGVNDYYCRRRRRSARGLVLSSPRVDSPDRRPGSGCCRSSAGRYQSPQ